MQDAGGFTIVELIITIVVMGILGSIVVVAPTWFLVSARDAERQDDVMSIARRLEQAYTAQEVGSPAYPTTTKLATDITGSGGVSSGTLLRLKNDAFRAPGKSTSSVISAISPISTTAPAGAGTPTKDQYVYQPLDSSGNLCTGSTVCVRFNFYYRQEKNNAFQVIKSLHQQ